LFAQKCEIRKRNLNVIRQVFFLFMLNGRKKKNAATHFGRQKNHFHFPFLDNSLSQSEDQITEKEIILAVNLYISIA
jgi:hypothetical protein